MHMLILSANVVLDFLLKIKSIYKNTMFWFLNVSNTLL